MARYNAALFLWVPGSLPFHVSLLAILFSISLVPHYSSTTYMRLSSTGIHIG